jgi:hypothetical protein
MLVTLAGLLTVLAAASPNAAEISVDNSLSGEAAGGPVALNHITVTIYKSRTVPFQKPFTKAIVGSNEIVTCCRLATALAAWRQRSPHR